MTVYVFLLKGINLGGRKVPMADLKELASAVGLSNPRTYVASGNLVAGSDRPADEIAPELETALEERFGFAIEVMSRTADEMARVAAANPYPDGDPKQVVVGFAGGTIATSAAEQIEALATPNEPFVLSGRELFVHFTDGQARSKLAARLSQAVGQSVTARNLRTVTHLASMSGPP